jgi:hypothetical protein
MSNPTEPVTAVLDLDSLERDLATMCAPAPGRVTGAFVTRRHQARANLLDALPNVVRELRRLRAAGDEARNLVRYCQIHSGYPDCGYDQMTTPQKTLYDGIRSFYYGEPEVAAVPASEYVSLECEYAACKRCVAMNGVETCACACHTGGDVPEHDEKLRRGPRGCNAPAGGEREQRLVELTARERIEAEEAVFKAYGGAVYPSQHADECEAAEKAVVGVLAVVNRRADPQSLNAPPCGACGHRQHNPHNCDAMVPAPFSHRCLCQYGGLGKPDTEGSR